MKGTLTNCYATGSVSGNNNYTGGLVGWKTMAPSPTVMQLVKVTGGYNIGGLAGWNDKWHHHQLLRHW
jgi:hypothetical protein